MRIDIIAALILMVASAGRAQLPATAPASGPSTQPAMTASADRRGDEISIAVGNATNFLTVTSRTGIGGGSVNNRDSQWPRLVLRLMLRSLESLTITAGDIRWEASVSSSDGKARITLSTPKQREAPVDEQSPYWTAIVARDADGQPVGRLPPAGGDFEMQIPAALLSDTQSIQLRWIDAYRN